MNRIKVNFICGTYRFVEFDSMHVEGEFTIFNLGDETQLTAVTRNMTYFEKATPAPESRDVDRPQMRFSSDKKNA